MTLSSNRNNESISDFLKQFPEQRNMVESYIRCLEEMVDNTDEVHKKCTTISIATNTIGFISSIFNLVKYGGRLCLGLEILGDVANISRLVYKNHNNFKIEDKCKKLLQQYENMFIFPGIYQYYSSFYWVNIGVYFGGWKDGGGGSIQ
uniref:Uncharacterized protein n=1 Tax=Chelydra serpentina TaxID=8475 RepID=A0A8C3RIX1_CHESE